MHSLRCSVPPQRPPVGCCSGPVVRSRGRVVTRFDTRDAIEQLQAGQARLQEGQAQVQEQVAEIMVQLQRLQPPRPRAPSMEVTLALMQQDLGYIKKDISDVKQDVSNLRDDFKQDFKQLDNKVVGLLVAVGVLGTLMGVKVFPLLRS